MRKISKLPQEVDIIAQLADLKEIDYKNMLILTALVELLIEKGLITRQEVLNKTKLLELDAFFSSEVL